MFSRIAIAGATGNLGLPILHAVLEAGFNVTVLSRVGGNSSKLRPHPKLVVKEVDFNSTDSLVSALEGVEAVVSCLATLAIGSQNPLIDAAVAVGVNRFIPAEFGMDSQNPFAMSLPVCQPKVATQKYLLAKSEAAPDFTFTGIANGLFLDWGLEVGFILDLQNHKATLYNGGNVPFSATTLADVARGVVGVLRNPVHTANKIVYIQSVKTTQNKLISYAKEHDEQNWTTVTKTTELVNIESIQELAKGPDANVDLAMLGFCIVGSWGPKYGGDFSSHLDNELLGIEQIDVNELKELVWNLL